MILLALPVLPAVPSHLLPNSEVPELTAPSSPLHVAEQAGRAQAIDSSHRSPPAALTSSPPEGRVAYTIDAVNRTVLPGVHLPDAGFGMSSEIVLPSSDTLLFSASDGGVWTVNTTTLLGAGRLSASGGGNGMAYDNRTGDIWTVGDPSSLFVIQLSDGTLVATNTSLPNGPVAVAYDWADNRMFVATRYTATLCIYNATSFQPVSSPIALNFTPSSLFYDGNGDRLFVGDMGYLVHVFDARHDTFTSTNWPTGGYATSMVLDPVHNWLYIANSGGSNISVVNLTSNRAVGTGVSTGPGPSGLTYDSGVPAIIVAPGGSSDGNLTVIPASGNSSFPGVRSIGCSFCGGWVAYVPSSGLVLLPQGGGYLAVLDPSAANPVHPDLQLVFSFPAAAYDPMNGELYVVDPSGENGSGGNQYPPYAPGNSSVLTLNATTYRFLGISYPVGFGTLAIAYDPSNGDLYTADTSGGTVSVIDPAADTVTTIPLGPPSDWNVTAPSAVSADAGNGLIYVTDSGTDHLSVINATSQTVTSTLAVGVDPDAVLVDSSNSRIYVANCGSDNLSVFNSSSRAYFKSLPVGICPDSLAVAPSGHLLLVANYDSSNVTVVNLTTTNVTASISTGTAGGSANGLSVDPANGYVYVADGYAYDVIAINATTLAVAGSPIAVTLGNYETYPTAVVFDPATRAVLVPTAFSSAIYVIANAPSVVFTNATPFPSEVGVPFEIDLWVENGTAPYSFAYAGLPAGCSSSGTPVLWCSAATTGLYNVTVTVTDSRNYSAISRVSEIVDARLGSPSLSVSPSPAGSGASITIAASASGGVPPYTYAYAGFPKGCPSTNLALWTCIPAVGGEFPITVNITDSLGVTQSAAATVSVLAGLVATLNVAGPSTVRVGSESALTASVAGGLAPYSYSYVGLPQGCTTNDSPALVCTPTTAGVFPVLLTVRDSLNAASDASATLTVIPAAEGVPSLLAFFANPTVVTLGNSTMLTVVLSPSTSNASFAFSQLPPGCTSENTSRLACTPTAIGPTTIQVHVELGGTSIGESQTNLSVVAASGLSNGPTGVAPGSTPPWEIGAAIAAAAVTGAALSFFINRTARRRRA